MSTRRRLHGLTVESDLRRHRTSTAEAPSEARADLRVFRGHDAHEQAPSMPGRMILDLEVGGRRYHTAARLDDGTVLLRCWGLCDFVLDPTLRTAIVHCVPGADVGLVDVLVDGLLPSLVLLLRRHGVLHASAVRLGGGCAAFVGRSGMGKSTVAAMLCSQGAALVTDDVLRFELRGERVVGYAGTSEVRLRPSAVALAERFPPDLRRTTPDGRTAVLAGPVDGEQHDLEAVVVPRLTRGSTSVSITPLSGAEALLALLRFPRLPGLIDPELLRLELARLAQLGSRVPVAILEIPWGRPQSHETAREVLAALDEVLPLASPRR